MKRDRASMLGDAGILLDPSFRAITALITLSAVVTSSAIPLLALFLTQDLGGNASDATALFVVLSIVGTSLALSTGRLSDRTHSRTGLVSFAFGCMACGYVLVAVSQTPLAVIMLGGAFLGAYAVANAQLFALVRERSVGEGRDDTAFRSSAFRALYSLGWVIGPVLGGVAYTYLGARASFAAAAALAATAIGVAAAGDLRRPVVSRAAAAASPPAGRADSAADAGQFARLPAVLVFAFALVLLASGGVMRSAVLPVHLAENLNLSGVQIGAVLAATPLAEIICLPIVGLICATWPRLTLYVGGLSAVAYFLGLAVADSLALVVMLQVLFAVYVAVVTVAGMLQLQQALPRHPGFATSGFFSTEMLATVVGSVVAAVGVGLLGEHRGFLVPMAVAAVGCALLVAALRHLPTSSTQPA